MEQWFLDRLFRYKIYRFELAPQWHNWRFKTTVEHDLEPVQSSSYPYSLSCNQLLTLQLDSFAGAFSNLPYVIFSLLITRTFSKLSVWKPPCLKKALIEIKTTRATCPTHPINFFLLHSVKTEVTEYEHVVITNFKSYGIWWFALWVFKMKLEHCIGAQKCRAWLFQLNWIGISLTFMTWGREFDP